MPYFGTPRPFLADPGPIGNGTPNTGKFTTVNTTSVGATTPGTGAFTTVSATGKITPATTSGIAGTTLADNAVAGSVGEYISSQVLIGAAVSVTAGVATNITSISLTAGDWDVWGLAVTAPAGSTVTNNTVSWTSIVSATQPTVPNNGAIISIPGVSTPGANIAQGIPIQRVNVASTTTVYLSTSMSFTTSTMGAYGFIGARRVR